MVVLSSFETRRLPLEAKPGAVGISEVSGGIASQLVGRRPLSRLPGGSCSPYQTHPFGNPG